MIPMCRALAVTAAVFLLTTITTFGADAPTAPKSVELICKVDSVLTPNSNDSIVIPVYMTNVTDSVAAFQVWIQSAYPEFIRFSADSSSGQLRAKIDKTGTRCSTCGMTSRILDPMQGIALIQGFPATPMPPGSGMLFKVILETNGTLPDSVCVNAELYLTPYQASFSNTNTQLIGCDYDSLGHCIMNFTKLVLVNGRVHIPPEYGDADGNCSIDISDAVRLVGYIFSGGQAPWPVSDGDANCDAAVDISDVVYLIAYIFSGGPAPCGRGR